MKYQGDLLRVKPGRAMVTHGPGDRLDSDGAPTRWLCPFRPENREGYLSLLRQACGWPALREIHLNDEASLSGGAAAMGCYCDFCAREFQERFGRRPPVSPASDAALWWDWVDHRMASWTALHAEFRRQVRDLRPDVAVGIQHSPLPAAFARSPAVLGLSLARDAAALDTLATDPYHFIHDGLIPYRPHRRILPETARSLAGACVGRGMNIYPQAFMPPSQSYPLTRQDGLMAGLLPFALGADTITPFAYDLMKIIPGFFGGLQDAHRLESELARRQPYASATVVRALQSEMRGHADDNWGRAYLNGVADLMFHTGLPWRWVWEERLEDAADSITGPLVVPEAHCLTETQRAAIRRVAERGEGVLWIGNVAQESWSGRGPCPLPAPFEFGAFELEPAGHPLAAGPDAPVTLATRTCWDGPVGKVAGMVRGRPGLVLNDVTDGREAWITGLPAHSFVREDAHAANRTRTSGVEVMRRLLLWLARREPLARLDPFPPPNAYGRLRPWDRRDVPTMELFPLVGEDSLLAILFLYAPVAFKTTLRVQPPNGRRARTAINLWSGRDWTPALESSPDGSAALRLEVPAETELLAILVAW
jgi:hypothetical protein